MTVFYKQPAVPAKLLPDNIMVYLKTTETCQLDCSHCFTSGKSGRAIYFDVENTKTFFINLHKHNPNQGGNIAFHGGEPMLAKISDMLGIHSFITNLLPNMWWSITTNLTYKLTDDIKQFFLSVFKDSGIGVSWDLDIRFDSNNQLKLWRENLQWLTDNEFNVTLMVSASRSLTKYDTKEFFEFIKSLKINYLHIERITPNGNALSNPDIFPTNKELDEWFVKLWDEFYTGEYYNDFSNEFFNSILTSLVQTQHSGCRCRECEQKIFTLNADGTVGGCPNSATTLFYGNVLDSLEQLFFSMNRGCNIIDEMVRATPCWSCDVYDICNGDCHQLKWNDVDGNIVDKPSEGDICPAPISLMRKLKNDYTYFQLNTVLGGFSGGE